MLTDKWLKLIRRGAIIVFLLPTSIRFAVRYRTCPTCSIQMNYLKHKTTRMDNYLIGDPECSFEEIADLLSKSKDYEKFVLDYDKIAATIGESNGNTSTRGQKNLICRKKNYLKGLEDLLKQWRKTYCNKATVSQLVYQLQQDRLDEYAKSLRRHFSFPESESEADDDGYPHGGLVKPPPRTFAGRQSVFDSRRQKNRKIMFVAVVLFGVVGIVLLQILTSFLKLQNFNAAFKDLPKGSVTNSGITDHGSAPFLSKLSIQNVDSGSVTTKKNTPKPTNILAGASSGYLDVVSNLTKIFKTTNQIKGTDNCTLITLQTPHEYFEKLTKLEDIICCRLLLHFQEDFLWHENSTEALNVTEIISKGTTPYLSLTKILEDNDDVKTITVYEDNVFFQTKDKIAEIYFSEDRYSSKIALNHLEILELHSVGNCERLTQFWCKNFKIQNLLSIAFACGLTTNTFFKNMQSLLENNHYSLTVLYVEMTDWKEPLFSSYSFFLRRLTELHIVVKRDRQNLAKIFDPSVVRIMPNLSNLNITGDHMQAEEIPVLYKFRALQYLSVRILTHESTFNTTSLVENLPALITLDLYVEFTNINDCILIRETTNTFRNFSDISSNCEFNKFG